MKTLLIIAAIIFALSFIALVIGSISAIIPMITKPQDEITYENYYVKVRSITISPENYDSDHSWDEAEFTAENILAKWKSGEATEESMISIMKQYGVNRGDGNIQTIAPGDWVDELDEWCFDRNRKVGDTAIIENVYGYTIVYFSGVIEINN